MRFGEKEVEVLVSYCEQSAVEQFYRRVIVGEIRVVHFDGVFLGETLDVKIFGLEIEENESMLFADFSVGSQVHIHLPFHAAVPVFVLPPYNVLQFLEHNVLLLSLQHGIAYSEVAQQTLEFLVL